MIIIPLSKAECIVFILIRNYCDCFKVTIQITIVVRSAML
jgi:hypothetical protein